jgi:hypothetical protein
MQVMDWCPLILKDMCVRYVCKSGSYHYGTTEDYHTGECSVVVECLLPARLPFARLAVGAHPISKPPVLSGCGAQDLGCDIG